MAQAIEQTYDEVVTKARHLFWTRGYQDVGVNDLAEHLDISPSLFYKKYSKDMLFVASLDSYVVSLSDPFMEQIRNGDQGMDTFKGFFNNLIDALLTKTFPRSCLIVNTVVEMHNEQDKVDLTAVYSRYFGNMRTTYVAILKRAVELKEVKNIKMLDNYADFLVGTLFGLSVLYKVKSKEELQEYVNQQLALVL
ncbi:MAG: TetR/AcrR family transcriptional repressor of nem operon [Saprospiraceae bacterium]|jgi:TetR/AcrR family transcriptional repressor of nem operon